MTGIKPTATKAWRQPELRRMRAAVQTIPLKLNIKSDLLRLCARIGYTPH